jgi:hypothetical protein
MISTLPDGSPYREIVRGMPTPQIEDLGGFKVSVWSAVSPNATSTIANLGSSALYTVEKDGKWYISTSKDLISLQFEKRPDSLLGAQPLIKSCASPLIDLRQEIEEMWILSSSPANSSSEQTATIASISQKTQEKKDIHILCVQ